MRLGPPARPRPRAPPARAACPGPPAPRDRAGRYLYRYIAISLYRYIAISPYRYIACYIAS